MRTIRVKQNNLNTIIEALQQAGFEARVSADVPVSALTLNQASFLDWSLQEELFESDKTNMAGIETSASGNQAHRVIQSLKQQGVIK